MPEPELHPWQPLPTPERQAGLSIWSPGLRLMRRIDLRQKALLLVLCSWLPALLLLVLALHEHAHKAEAPVRSALRSTLAAPVAADSLMRLRFDALRDTFDMHIEALPAEQLGQWVMVALALLASLYLMVCAWMAIGEGLRAIRRSAQAIASGKLDLQSRGFGSDELGQALTALNELAARLSRLHQTVVHGASAVLQSSHEMAASRPELHAGHAEIRMAIGELARRTLALCGLLDAGTKDVERAGVDLDAIQDEECQTVQLMAGLRDRLLALNSYCQALGEAAQAVAAATPGSDKTERALRELVDTAKVEIVQCHRLSERVAGAERSSERRIESLRRSTDSLLRHAERGICDAHQLMVLTRQIESSSLAASRRLEQLSASCGVLGAQAEDLGRAVQPWASAADLPAS